ncbi:hypothetical protein OBBRIDRAFT_794347 [Obba rivulosa]|uniref:Uncharacterized protein n=1 Tax=Obba rivulosa TaxID=1052685 RepID=A0A8E2AZE5_9APHY|nr:hypothetical protein OBBRIDRAFT_794347 [Obba rivulosa]
MGFDEWFSVLELFPHLTRLSIKGLILRDVLGALAGCRRNDRRQPPCPKLSLLIVNLVYPDNEVLLLRECLSICASYHATIDSLVLKIPSRFELPPNQWLAPNVLRDIDSMVRAFKWMHADDGDKYEDDGDLPDIDDMSSVV